MDKKLTDSEIIKALECCVSKGYPQGCDDCPYRGLDCNERLDADALDLINRKDEEVNRLQEENEGLKKANGLFEYLNKAVYLQSDIPFEFKTIEAKNNAINKYIDKMCNIQIAKAEAYKEFAERLDKEFSGVGTCNYGCVHHKTRKVLKELVGEDNVTND